MGYSDSTGDEVGGWQVEMEFSLNANSPLCYLPNMARLAVRKLGVPIGDGSGLLDVFRVTSRDCEMH